VRSRRALFGLSADPRQTTMSPENYSPLSEHERFEQMCALMAVGELPEEGFREFQRHLIECGSCQQLYTDFCRIGSDDLGFAAAHRSPETATPSVPATSAAMLSDASSYLERLYARIADAAPKLETLPQHGSEAVRRSEFPLRQIAGWAVAAILLVAIALGSFRYRQALQLAADAQSRFLQAQVALQRQSSLQPEPASGDAFTQLQQTVLALTAARDELQRELAEAGAKNRDWQAKTADLTKQLLDVSAQADLTSRNLQQALGISRSESEKRNESEQQLRTAVRQSSALQEQRTEAMVHASEQERQIAELREKLAAQSVALERTQAAVTGAGQEGKNLFGARNLHIVDVYDVDGNGNTKRTFGRVYYVEKQLLVFYAFDLETKRRNQLAAGFQAWGYREVGTGKPESLGMFHLDDPSLNRWTLSVNDPHVLEHIDALFVTLEPPEGSPTPKGRRLLYASLAGVPNHP
jgi:hypothetical protein